MYKIQNLSFSYFDEGTEFTALKEVNLEIHPKEFITLAGPSGSGKSTLLNLLGFIENPPEGTLFYDGADVSRLSEKDKNHIRRFELGFIFQHFNLFPVLSAYENVEYFLIKQGLHKSERDKRVKWALESVGLQDHMHKVPGQLSGGQRQRVAIARAIAKKPKIIIGDEPTASLDSSNAQIILDYLSKVNKEEHVSIILASHDQLVLKNSPKIIALKDGRVNP